MSRNADIAAIVRDPHWLAHRYDPVRDAVHFRHVSREDHRAATFLTDEHLPASGKPRAIPRHDTIAAGPATGPVHFIFHSAYCCSTLLARAFDIEGVAMGLKEPVILNDLSGWRQRGSSLPQFAQVLDDTLTLLSRPFASGEAVIIKPSNLMTAHYQEMLAIRPDSRALLLHAPLPVFLGSVARKGMWGRLWVRDLLVKLLADDAVDLGFDVQDYLRLTDLQAAAVGWLAQHAMFARLIERFGAGRLRTLDSETLLARPREAVGALVQFYGLALDETTTAAIATGRAFTTHSKLDRPFDGDARAKERSEEEEAHGDELEKVSTWANAVAANAGVELQLKVPLLP